MSSNEPNAVNSKNTFIFDADFHLTEGLEDFAPYLESPYRDVLNRRFGDGYPDLYPGGGMFSPAENGRTYRDLAPSNQLSSREDILVVMEELDIDTVLVQPTSNLTLACIHQDEMAAAIATAYNEWLLDEILDPDHGIYGSVLVAPQLPERAATEITDRGGNPQFVATMIPSGGCVPPLGHRRYHPIYEASENAGLPVTLHNADVTAMMGFPAHFRGYTKGLTVHTTSHPIQHISHMTNMIVQGVPVKYPDLDIVMQEAGIGWIPFMMRRMDNEYMNMREDAPMLEKMPSEYVRDQFYFTTQPLEGHGDLKYVTNMIELIGTGNVLFSSDYPHFDFDHTNELVRRLRNLTSEDIEHICGRNARNLFGV